MTTSAFSQVKIGGDVQNIDQNAIFEMESSEQGMLLPRMSEMDKANITSPTAGLMIYNTDIFCTEIYNGTEWINLCDGAPQCVIGDTGPSGGIIFYCDGNGGGLEAAPSDWNGTSPVDPNAPWGCSGTSVATSDDFGTGASNTQNIVSACSEPDIAARWANDYFFILNGIVYEGWYLPSRDELTLMYNTIGGGASNQGGFRNVTYWSSSQRSATQAYGRNLISGAETTFGTAKTGLMGVRAIRAF
ncbi:MAG: DUF1566 domain-containing protein [Chitinophagaceae bacterium]|nr:MAG: DUF1566 domain-containing protein [Chitinophagaceae bacterium]